jgi:hypothetical protein
MLTYLSRKVKIYLPDYQIGLHRYRRNDNSVRRNENSPLSDDKTYLLTYSFCNKPAEKVS